jgi:hypothetical protein
MLIRCALTIFRSYTQRNRKEKSNMNSIIKIQKHKMSHSNFPFFCFFVCILNLVLNILEDVNKYLVNRHKFVLNFFMLTNLNF